MKLILSRKGFDSAAGGVASPILPDGSMLSLPIPDKSSPIRYDQLHPRGHALGGLVPELTRGKVKPHYGAHLDPDLDPTSLPRIAEWRPIFGQAGSEQTVLANAGVGPGDLFLFFGWFCQADLQGGTLRAVKRAPQLHVLWGWMQIEAMYEIATSAVPSWASYHPHVASPQNRTNNTLYVSRERLSFDGAVPGAGIFPRFDQRLLLTKLGASRSVWTLPSWFHPDRNRPPLGFHSDPTRWTRAGDRVELQTVGRGQEFVLDMALYPEADAWFSQLLRLHD